MNKKSIMLMLSAVAILGAASVASAQTSSKSQAGGLPALADEVASLRAAVQALQAQVGDNTNPYSGAFAVTVFETGVFGCGTTNGPPPGPLQPYLNTQGISSVSLRSGAFTAQANGMVLTVPQFPMLSQELRLSGNYQTDTEAAGGVEIVIGGNGSLSADLGPYGQVSGQFARDGSTFTALVRGSSVEGICDDAFTVLLTGVKK